MENGLFEFMVNVDRYWNRMLNLSDTFEKRHAFEFEPITLEEFYYPLIVYLCHLSIAILVFICEIFWQRFQQIYNQSEQLLVGIIYPENIP